MQLNIRGSSSAHISWTPLSLPVGISLARYQVSYGLKHHEEKKEFSFSPDDTQRTIHNLTSHQLYNFEVSAVVMERDGSMHVISMMSSPTGGQDFFVPGESSVIVQ